LQLLHRHACVSENAAQGSLGDITAGMNRHGGTAPVRMTHDVVAPGNPSDLESSFL